LIDASTCGKSLGDSRDGYSGGSDHFGEVVGRCLSLNIGPEREDHLRRTLPIKPLHQLSDPEIFRSDAIERGEFASERMVTATEGTSPLQGKDIGRRLHDAEFLAIPRGITTEKALLGLGEKAAKTAGPQDFPCPGNGKDQLVGLGIGGTGQPEGNPFGTAGTDSGKPAKLADQFPEGFRIIQECGHESRKAQSPAAAAASVRRSALCWEIIPPGIEESAARSFTSIGILAAPVASQRIWRERLIIG